MATVITPQEHFPMPVLRPTGNRGKTAPTAALMLTKTVGLTAKTRTQATIRNGRTLTETAMATTQEGLRPMLA